jgi:hypothetical protein
MMQADSRSDDLLVKLTDLFLLVDLDRRHLLDPSSGSNKVTGGGRLWYGWLYRRSIEWTLHNA